MSSSQSWSLSVCLEICLEICPSACLSACPPVCLLSVCLSVCLSVSLLVCLPVYTAEVDLQLSLLSAIQYCCRYVINGAYHFLHELHSQCSQFEGAVGGLGAC